MKRFSIEFANGQVVTMTVTADDIDPRNEVDKWEDPELTRANIVSLEELE